MGIGDFLDDVAGAAEQGIGDTLEWGKKKLEGAADKAEDLAEVISLKNDFETLENVQLYFKNNAAKLSQFGALDIWWDPQKVAHAIGEAGSELDAGIVAVANIQETNLHFSSYFMGPAVKTLENAITELQNSSLRKLHDIADSLHSGEWSLVSFFSSKKNEQGIVEASLAIRQFQSNAEIFKAGLEGLIGNDGAIAQGEPTNNKYINTEIKKRRRGRARQGGSTFAQMIELLK